MDEKVLLIDDDVRVLEGYQRLLRKRFVLSTASTPEQALWKLRVDGPFAVMVSDLRMPGMDGMALLGQARECAPDTVRILLTGAGNLHVAMDAVNEARVFRFLTKPCPIRVLEQTIEAALKQHRLVRAERDLLELTLARTIRVLTEVLELVNPTAFGRSLRVRGYVGHLVRRLELGDGWKYEIAAMLSQLGWVTLDAGLGDAVSTSAGLSDSDRGRIAHHPQVARDLVASIPRLEEVAEMIGRQQSRVEAPQMFRTPAARETATLGAHLLRVAIEFDRLLMGGATPRAAVQRMLGQPEEFESAIVEALKDAPMAGEEVAERTLPLRALSVGMILVDDLRDAQGIKILDAGTHLTMPLVHRVREWCRQGLSDASELRVRVPHAHADAPAVPSGCVRP